MKTGLFALLLVRFAFPAAAEPPLARWVPADQAVVDGRLVIEAFDDDALFDMERWLLREKPKANPCGHEARVEPAYRSCDLLSVLSYERELLTPERVLAEASHAAVGTVSHLEPGLYRGRLATLVTVTVDRWLLFPGSSLPSTVAFLTEETQLVITDIRYCQKGFRAAPLIAGRRILLAASIVLHDEPLVLFAYDSHVFYETSESAVSLGAPGSPSWAESWSQFEAGLYDQPVQAARH